MGPTCQRRGERACAAGRAREPGQTAWAARCGRGRQGRPRRWAERERGGPRGEGVCGSWARDWAAGAGVGRAAGKKRGGLGWMAGLRVWAGLGVWAGVLGFWGSFSISCSFLFLTKHN